MPDVVVALAVLALLAAGAWVGRRLRDAEVLRLADALELAHAHLAERQAEAERDAAGDAVVREHLARRLAAARADDPRAARRLLYEAPGTPAGAPSPAPGGVPRPDAGTPRPGGLVDGRPGAGSAGGPGRVDDPADVRPRAPLD
ncbi:MAG: hypothetical protein M9894_16220 [Planctomycetes bacterium]|nr:hypothetical protein [Planctomycetota bacterium]